MAQVVSTPDSPLAFVDSIVCRLFKYSCVLSFFMNHISPSSEDCSQNHCRVWIQKYHTISAILWCRRFLFLKAITTLHLMVRIFQSRLPRYIALYIAQEGQTQLKTSKACQRKIFVLSSIRMDICIFINIGLVPVHQRFFFTQGIAQ